MHDWDASRIETDYFLTRVEASLARSQTPAEFDVRAAVEETHNIAQIVDNLVKMEPTETLVVVWLKYDEIPNVQVNRDIVLGV